MVAIERWRTSAICKNVWKCSAEASSKVKESFNAHVNEKVRNIMGIGPLALANAVSASSF